MHDDRRDSTVVETGPELTKVLVKLADSFKTWVESKPDASGLSAKLDQILQGEQHIMSAVTEWAAKEQADLTAISAKLDDIVSGVAALDKLITDFQNSPGTLSASDQAALDAIQAQSKAVVSKAQAIDTTAPASTPPVGGV